METVMLAIATIFLTKALEKSGEMFGEGLITKTGQAITKIRHYSPETAKALEAGDPKVLNLNPTVLEKIPPDPIFAELVTAAGAEKNATFQEKFQAIKAGGNINIIGKQITITQNGTGNTQTNTFSNF